MLREFRELSRRTSSGGFTLIEMSIVLVIIGLIVGGVLVGQSLIRQTQINSIETQSASIGQALNTFRDKYGGVPGEINFQPFFPQIIDGSGYYCSGPSGAPGTTTIDDLIDTTYENETAYAELQAAGLVPMGRPQILQSGTVQPFWNCLQNDMQQTAAFSTKLDSSIYAEWDTLNGKQSLSYGSASIPALTVAEAYAFDLKYDDGIAGTGIINGLRADGPGYCTSGVTPDQYCEAPGQWCTGQYRNYKICMINVTLP